MAQVQKMGGVDIWMGLCDSYMFIWQWKFPGLLFFSSSHLKYLNLSSANSPPNRAGSFFLNEWEGCNG